jgi:hypothetical protein
MDMWRFGVVVVISVIASSPANADVNCTVSNHPFARGYCNVTQCAHGQWVRGSASVAKDGTVQAKLGLETDNLTYGICGHAEFVFKDSTGKVVGKSQTDQRCIPSKKPGKARIVDFPQGVTKVSPENAAKITTVETTVVSCDRHPIGFLGINLDPIKISASWDL